MLFKNRTRFILDQVLSARFVFDPDRRMKMEGSYRDACNLAAVDQEFQAPCRFALDRMIWRRHDQT